MCEANQQYEHLRKYLCCFKADLSFLELPYITIVLSVMSLDLIWLYSRGEAMIVMELAYEICQIKIATILDHLSLCWIHSSFHSIQKL